MSGFSRAAQRNPNALSNIGNMISGAIYQYQQNAEKKKSEEWFQNVLKDAAIAGEEVAKADSNKVNNRSAFAKREIPFVASGQSPLNMNVNPNASPLSGVQGVPNDNIPYQAPNDNPFAYNDANATPSPIYKNVNASPLDNIKPTNNNSPLFIKPSQDEVYKKQLAAQQQFLQDKLKDVKTQQQLDDVLKAYQIIGLSFNKPDKVENQKTVTVDGNVLGYNKDGSLNPNPLYSNSKKAEYGDTQIGNDGLLYKFNKATNKYEKIEGIIPQKSKGSGSGSDVGDKKLPDNSVNNVNVGEGIRTMKDLHKANWVKAGADDYDVNNNRIPIGTKIYRVDGKNMTGKAYNKYKEDKKRPYATTALKAIEKFDYATSAKGGYETPIGGDGGVVEVVRGDMEKAKRANPNITYDEVIEKFFETNKGLVQPNIENEMKKLVKQYFEISTL